LGSLRRGHFSGCSWILDIVATTFDHWLRPRA